MAEIKAINISNPREHKVEVIDATKVKMKDYMHLSGREFTIKEIEWFWVKDIKKPKTKEVEESGIDEELEAIKDEAESLGVNFQDNWKKETILKHIEKKKAELGEQDFD